MVRHPHKNLINIEHLKVLDYNDRSELSTEKWF